MDDAEVPVVCDKCYGTGWTSTDFDDPREYYCTCPKGDELRTKDNE